MLTNQLQSTSQHRRYFQIPNDIFNLGLSDGAILVYTYLMYCEDRKTYKCYPSFRTIGKAISRSRNSVSKYVCELEEKHLITTEPTKVTLKNGKRHNGSLLYTILPIHEAVEYYSDWQMDKLRCEYARVSAEKRLEEYDRKHGRQTN